MNINVDYISQGFDDVELLTETTCKLSLNQEDPATVESPVDDAEECIDELLNRSLPAVNQNTVSQSVNNADPDSLEIPSLMSPVIKVA